MNDNENLKYNGFVFIGRLEKLWKEKESKKPKENQRKFTQTVLADDLGIDDGAISRWQKAKEYPKIDTLYKIKKHFGCSLDYLIGDDDIIQNDEMTFHDLIKMLLLFDLKNNVFTFETYTNVEEGCPTINGVIIKLEDNELTVDDTVPNLEDYKGLFDGYNKIKDFKNEVPFELKKELLSTILKHYAPKIYGFRIPSNIDDYDLPYND